jgi:hypothetical protein
MKMPQKFLPLVSEEFIPRDFGLQSMLFGQTKKTERKSQNAG